MIKKILRIFLPQQFRKFLWRIIPKLRKTNTYILNYPSEIKELYKIDDKYYIREVAEEHLDKIKKAHISRAKNAFKNRVVPRLRSPAWTGLAVFDKTTGDIAYIAWIIHQSIPYFEEFGVYLKDKEFLLKDGYCLAEYRHQGLHTRMEQERINYCIKHGAQHIFIQIEDKNKKGIDSVLGNGYTFYRQDYVIQWPLFNVFRSFKGFLRNPFRKIIK